MKLIFYKCTRVLSMVLLLIVAIQVMTVDMWSYAGETLQGATALEQGLQQQIKYLAEEDGWDLAATNQYKIYVMEKINLLNTGYGEQQVIGILESSYSETKKIGSQAYMQMFEKSQINAKDKVLLVIRHLGGFLDENQMLQLKGGYEMDENMQPHSVFLEEYAKCVRQAYAGKVLDDMMIHQFRMYIDRHNINFIRNNYMGSTDLEKLQAYASENNFELWYDKNSCLHNRYYKGENKDWESLYGMVTSNNLKVKTPNGLSEYVVDMNTGKFITQWDYLIVQNGLITSSFEAYPKDAQAQKSIVETESFNYAKSGKAHMELDIMPANGISGYENMLKQTIKKNWKYVKKEEIDLYAFL